MAEVGTGPAVGRDAGNGGSIEEGLPHAEAGEVLGVSESTVSWRMHEVRKRLRALAAEDEEMVP